MLMRRVLLYLSTAGWARNITMNLGVARRVALRFVAGETLDDALKITQQLKNQGLLATLDYLGESVHSVADAEAVAAMYCDMIAKIEHHTLDSSVSLKLTHLGLDISEEVCVNNLRQILRAAQAHGNIPVTIDMESTAYTDVTLRIYRSLRDQEGFTNLGTVIQAYLYRSQDDLKALAAENAHIRLCKGAYLEPAAVAYPEKADVDKSYVQLAETYLTTPTQAYLCLATHDENMIAQLEQRIQQHNIASSRYEFQMLYGIRSQRQQELAQAGYKMRVYVPFGEAWYPYFMRRLAERPANVWFFVRSLFKS